jgi:glycerophosphoryl diester phosphodiesterase
MPLPRLRHWRASALLLLAGCAAPDAHPFFEGRPRPLLFAHRGGGGALPEATLPALLDAATRNPEWVVEFDVGRSKDGTLVVIHDDTVDRTTNGSGRVDSLTLAELQALDAGDCARPGVGDGTAPAEECRAEGARAEDFPFRGQGYRIPTLAEVLEALPPGVPISIEAKEPGFEAQLAEQLRASGRLEQLVVGSAEDEVSLRLKALLPEAAHYLPTNAATCVGLTAKAALASYPGCPEYEVFASPLRGAGLALDTQDVLDAAHARGMRVIYWTINEEAELERLFRLGVDGVFTDYPIRAQAVLERLRAAGELP